jgi:hypothetical protein
MGVYDIWLGGSDKGESRTRGNRWSIYLLARFGGITAEPTYPIHRNRFFAAVHQHGAPPLSLSPPSPLTSYPFSSWFSLFFVLLEPPALSTGVLLITPARYGIGEDDGH